ncbi:MAG: S41 family peptidase [Burkholderiales bacterium]|nr:S41 family peptidase [Burkholderiales bacterium]
MGIGCALAGEHSEAVERIADLLDQIRARYVEHIDDEKLIENAVNGVLKGLDPYSKYMDAENFEKLQSHNRGEYGGVGIEVRTEAGGARILTAFEGAPAQRAGLKQGDLILKIDQTALQGMELEQITQLMRGRPDTDVRLMLVPEGAADPVEVVVQRAVIKWQSVRAHMLDNGYAYVRITNFQEHTGEMLVAALGGLWKTQDGKVSGIVLDLRDNPGGLITAAVGVSSAFLPANAPIAYADGSGSASKMRLYARKEDYLRAGESDYLINLPAAVREVPMAVLVNKNSASSSEIVAGALQDHKRAVVVGTLTYGKGSIQRMFPQSDGSGLKITTSHYFLPGGRKVHGKGIQPDLVVEKDPMSAVATAPVDGGKPAQPVAVTGDVASADPKRPAPAMCSELVRASAAEGDKPTGELDCQLQEALRVLRARTEIGQS